MDNISTIPTIPSKPSFFKQVFELNTKRDILNICQYCILIIIPIIIVERNINFFFPNLDKTKGSLELGAEALGQLLLELIIVLFIHRAIMYFTPWGGGSFENINFPTFVILYLWLIFTFNLGHIGSKIDLIVNRLLPMPRKNFWDPMTLDKKNNNKTNPIVRLTQPLSGPPPPIPTQQTTPPNYISTQNTMAAGNPVVPQVNTQNTQYGSMSQYTQALDNATIAQNTGNSTNFNNMYDEAGANNIGGGPIQEPMAANSVLGGGAFSSF